MCRAEKGKKETINNITQTRETRNKLRIQRKASEF